LILYEEISIKIIYYLINKFKVLQNKRNWWRIYYSTRVYGLS